MNNQILKCFITIIFFVLVLFLIVGSSPSFIPNYNANYNKKSPLHIDDFTPKLTTSNNREDQNVVPAAIVHQPSRQQQLSSSSSFLGKKILNNNNKQSSSYVTLPPSRARRPPQSPSFSVSLNDLPSASDLFHNKSSRCATIFQPSDKDTPFIANAYFGIRKARRAITGAENNNNNNNNINKIIKPRERIPTCPIDNAGPSSRKLHYIENYTTQLKNFSCSRSFDVALVGQLYRPQHTMQFLFSLLGLVCLQSELKLLYGAKNVAVFVSVMKYAGVGSAADFCRKKYPHFELLDLLIPPDATPENGLYLFRDAEWAAHSIRAKDFAMQEKAYYHHASIDDNDGGTHKKSYYTNNNRNNNKIANDDDQDQHHQEKNQPEHKQKQKIAGECIIIPSSKSERKEEQQQELNKNTVPKILSEAESSKTNFCIKNPIWGSIPVRIPGNRIKNDPSLKPRHFQDFRQRMIDRWILRRDDDDGDVWGSNNNNFLEQNTNIPRDHILLVRRNRDNGRFLNRDHDVATVVKNALATLDQQEQQEQKDEEDIMRENKKNSTTTKQTSAPLANNNSHHNNNGSIIDRKIIVVQWEGMTLRDQLRMSVFAKAIIGTHGNGLTWACFMPLNSFIIEFSSNIKLRNEVFEGINIANAGNIAGACGMKSLSLRSGWRESALSKNPRINSPSHKWKLVDIEPSDREMMMIEKFITSNGTKMY